MAFVESGTTNADWFVVALDDINIGTNSIGCA